MIRRRAVVHGLVQGVGFRWSAAREAARLGVAGWVRNRSDGTVEAAVEGPVGDVEAMLRWFGHGPAGAVVRAVDVVDEEPTGATGFVVEP